MKKIILGLLFSVFATSSYAANWYVSQSVASSGNGQSWGTAWKNSKNIVWGSIQAGDIIYFDGGSSGTSYEAFNTITANGTSSSYITIARSLEAGRDGIVTFATPCPISGNYIKFDGGGYKLLSGTTYRCGIVFTCSGNTTSPVSFTGGQAVNVGGQRPWFRYVYFNGTFSSGSGNSLGVRNSTGFLLENCWFFQANYEDQLSWSPSATGARVEITKCVFQDNNRPNRSDTAHRDVINTWTGSGGYDLIIRNNIFFNTPGHASDQPQGDVFLLQDAYSGSAAKLGTVEIINNVFSNTARPVAFGTKNSGATMTYAYNNTYVGTNGLVQTNADPGVGTPLTSANNTNASAGYLNKASPLGADGIPFTPDDGFNLVSSATTLIDDGSVLPAVPTDILGNSRGSAPDLGAYEYNGVVTNTLTVSKSGSGAGTVTGTGINCGSDCTETYANPTNITLTPTPTGTNVFTGWSGACTGTGNCVINVTGYKSVTAGFSAPPPSVSDGTTINTTGGAIVFNLTDPGTYKVVGTVTAPNTGANSLFVDIDNAATTDAKIWDISSPVTAQAVDISWRGANASTCYDVPTCAEFNPKTWSLTAGIHTLYVTERAGEEGVSIQAVRFVKVTSGSTPHPADTNSDFLMSLNEVTTFGACWKTNCNANATLDNAVRAGTLWNATVNGQYQYNSAVACPACWEIKP